MRWWSALAYYAHSLAGAMEAGGDRCRIVAVPGSPLAGRAARAGLLAPEYDSLASRRPDRILRAIRSLRRRAFDGTIRGVIAHTGVGHAAAALALRGTPAPLLRVRAEIRPPSDGPLQRWLYTKATDRVLVSGDFLRRTGLERLGVDPGRIETVPAGFSLAAADAVDSKVAGERLRAQRGWPASEPVVGMLARYSPVKGHRTFVDAAARLTAEGAGARFYLAGPDGQTGRAEVERWVREAGLAESFAVLDEVADPMQVAAGFDIAVIASNGSEAVCRSALEYMALGLPVVATDVHVIPETIGDAGLVVAPDDPAGLAGAIGTLLDDSEQRRLLGEKGASRLRDRFDQDRLARRVAAILEEVRGERVRNE